MGGGQGWEGVDYIPTATIEKRKHHASISHEDARRIINGDNGEYIRTFAVVDSSAFCEFSNTKQPQAALGLNWGSET